jgi:hypothetical protein
MFQNPDPRLAAAGLRASGIVGGVGLVFLVGMFAAFAAGARSLGMTLGWINDVTGVITLPLALPGVLALHRRLRPRANAEADALLLVGIGAGGTIVVLQLLLVAGVVTFEKQIGPVSLAFLVLAVFFVLFGRLATRHGVAPGGARLGLVAASYAGYPVWAFRLARAVEVGAVALEEPAVA